MVTEAPATTGADRKPDRSVHRLLAMRMLIAAVSTSVLVGVLAVLAERRSIGEVAVDRAAAGVAALMAFVENAEGPSDRMDGARVQTALERLKASAALQKSGRFVAVHVYDMERRRIAQLEDRSHPAFAAMAGSPGGEAPAGASYVYSRPNGVPAVAVTVPIVPRTGSQLGFVNAVFAVSEEEFAEAKARILRRVLIAVGIVLVTVTILYPIIARLVERLRRASHKLLDSNLDSIAALGSAIAKKDSDTDIHNYRVTIYSVRLGEAAGLSRHAICALIKGAFLHDVGKIGIPDKVLLKPGRLDEQEFAEMKKHVQYGIDIAQQSAWLKDAIDVVGGHHEKFDGSGYFGGLRGEDIPINARIFALADVFDALTSRRPYKEPMSYEEAMVIIEKGRGVHFDPRLLDLFAAIARRLYDEFANRDDEGPRVVLRSLMDEYFKADAEILVA